MRVVYLADAPYVHTRRWVQHFARTGWEAHVVSFRAAQIDGARVHAFERFGAIGKLRYLLYAPSVRRLVSELRPDLIHALHVTSYGFVAGLCAAHPTLTSVWGRDVLAVAGSTPLHTFLTRYALAKADHITATGPRLANATLRYAPREKPITVVPYGVDLARFTPARRNGSVSSKVAVGAVARLSPEKGLDVLLRAAARLIGKGMDVRVVLAGDGPERMRLEKLAKRLQIDGRVSFLGEVAHDRVPDVLGGLDIFAMPSREEGFGVAALEAAAMELPVVASNVHGIPDVVEDGRTGILVPPGDEAALVDALEALATDPLLRERLGRAGREFVTERYRWEDNAAQMERLYQHLVSSFSERSPRATVAEQRN